MATGVKADTRITFDKASNRLKVTDFECSDKEILDFFSEVPEEQLEERFLTALKMGVVALKTVSNAERVDYVEKCFAAMETEFKSEMKGAFGDKGKADALIGAYLGEDGKMKRLLDNFMGAEGHMSRRIDEHFGPNGKIVKDLFDPNRPETPLGKVMEKIERQFEDLRKELAIAEKEEEIAGKTPIKGKVFEDEFMDLLSGIARNHSDCVEKTTDTPGLLKGSKKGDFVVVLSENDTIKVVFETKDIETVSLNTIQSSMKEALENRGAVYGVFVVKDLGCLPKSVGWFNEYGGTTLVLALGYDGDDMLKKELLWIGYKWARIRALTAGLGKKEGIDIEALLTKVKRAEDMMKSFTQMRTQCTNAENAIKEIRLYIDELKDGLEGLFEDIQKELSKGEAQ